MQILANTGNNASSIIGVIFSLFGGELLLLCLKRIFTDPDKTEKGKDQEVNDDECDR